MARFDARSHMHRYRDGYRRFVRRGLERIREELRRAGWFVVARGGPLPDEVRRAVEVRRALHSLYARVAEARRREEEARRARLLYAHVAMGLARLVWGLLTLQTQAVREGLAYLGIATAWSPALRRLARVWFQSRLSWWHVLVGFLEELGGRSWLWGVYSRVRYALALHRLVTGIREAIGQGELVPLFEARVVTLPYARIWRIVAWDSVVEQLPEDMREALAETIIHSVLKGRPLALHVLNPLVRMLLAMVLSSMRPDKCHSKPTMVRVTPVILRRVQEYEEKTGARIERVWVFLRVVRVEDARADPLAGKAIMLRDPVLGELLLLKPDEDETSIKMVIREPGRFDPRHSRWWMLKHLPPATLVFHDAAVRRATAVAAGVAEEAVSEDINPCSVYWAPGTWKAIEDFTRLAEKLGKPIEYVLRFSSKPAKRAYGAVGRLPVDEKALESL